MRILERIKNLTILWKKKNIHVLVIAGIFLFIGLYLLMLTPLKKTIDLKRSEWRNLETRLIAGRMRLDAYLRLNKSEVDAELEESKRRLPSESPTSAILEELTKRGKELNVEFISITPKPVTIPRGSPAATSKLKYKVLPIEIKMKATYRSLAEYLSILENLERSFATISGFQIKKDEKIFPKLNVNLLIYTYIVEDEGGQE